NQGFPSSFPFSLSSFPFFPLYPPVAFIKRRICGSSAKSKLCCKGLCWSALIIMFCKCAGSAENSRKGARKSTLFSCPRHNNKRPVAVTRIRLQLLQKFSLCGEIKPIRESYPDTCQ